MQQFLKGYIPESVICNALREHQSGPAQEVPASAHEHPCRKHELHPHFLFLQARTPDVPSQSRGSMRLCKPS